MQKILEVKNFKISFYTEFGKVEAVRDFSFDLFKGETLAIVGESGSGKSVCAHSITGLMKNAGAIMEGGTLRLDGAEIPYDDEKTLRKIRGGSIAYIFQEPMASLNPLHSIERQITERLIFVEGVKQAEAKVRALELLNLVGVYKPETRLDDLPHCFSGGERQRIMIAAALASNPQVLIADEPTTALDVTVQKQILDLLEDLKEKLHMSILLITHDLGIVRNYADRTVVVKDGIVVETGDTETIFTNPTAEYTKELIGSGGGSAAPVHGSGEPILKAEKLSVSYAGRGRYAKHSVKAVNDVSFDVRKGHSLGIVGESGSGKTSLIKALLRLIPFTGDIYFKDGLFSALKPEALRKMRKYMQVVFQDPYGSLNPRMTVRMIVAEGLLSQGEKDKSKVNKAVEEALQDVGLDASIADRYPHEFSGGQRQRIAIARAVILRPELVIFDEPTSSLDRSVQFQVVNLLKDLQQRYNMSYIFISHDLNLVRSVCHDIIVMKSGNIVEKGRIEDVLYAPKEEYTKTLIDAAFIH